MVAQKLFHVVSLQPFSAVCPFIFTIMFNYKLPVYDKNIFSAGNVPPLGAVNNTQFYGTGRAGSFIGNLTQVGVRTNARLWSGGQQIKLNARNGQFNIF